MKTCFKCGVEQPLTEFYRHPEMADGLLSKCKTCTKLDVRIDRAKRPNAREYDRRRAALPHRIKLRKRITEQWKATHQEEARAVRAANNAVRDGKLEKPALCEGCQLPKRLEKHHPDYSKPLFVLWLCKPCHAIADKLRRRLEEAS